jgi:hypothetical protein
VRSFIEQEYSAFPVCAHDDMLDCMSRILDDDMGVIFPEPEAEKVPKWMRDMEDDREHDFMTS